MRAVKALWWAAVLAGVACARAEMQKTDETGHPFGEWGAWRALDLSVGYANLSRTETGLQLWFGASYRGVDRLVRLQGDRPERMERVPPQFDTRRVKGYDRDLDGRSHPILSRVSGTVLPDGTSVVYGAIGPRYTGGGSELFPALFSRRPGGEWRHLGPPAGEPMAFLDAAERAGASVRCEGGGLVVGPEGRLRLYAHGMLSPEEVPGRIRDGRVRSNRIPVAEADGLEGDWRFRRDAEGKWLDITRGSGLPWLFPHVQPLGDWGWMLTGADAWPPQRIYAAYSRDGLVFTLPVDDEGKAVPLLRAREVRADARFIKILRGAWDPKRARFVAVASISRPEDQGRSALYTASVEVEPEAMRGWFGDGKGPEVETLPRHPE